MVAQDSMSVFYKIARDDYCECTFKYVDLAAIDHSYLIHIKTLWNQLKLH